MEKLTCRHNSRDRRLAIVFTCRRFNISLWQELHCGKQPQPLEIIHPKTLATAPRLQGMLLKPQGYGFKIIYRPGRDMLLADRLSRCPSHNSTQPETKTKHTVHSIAFIEGRLDQLRLRMTLTRTVRQLIETGWPQCRKVLSN